MESNGAGKLLLAVTLFVLSTSICSAEGFQSSSLLLSDQMTIGRYTIKTFTHNPIDTSLLLQDLTATDSAETIKSKINKQREIVFPNEEIVVEVAVNAAKFQRQSND
jgi:hypothetical protein